MALSIPDVFDDGRQSTTSSGPHLPSGRRALIGFGYAHFIMIFGIILIAAGLEVGIAHPLEQREAVDEAGIWNLAAGLALYLIGDTLYRRVLHIGSGRLHLLIAAPAIFTIPLGLIFGALAQLAECVLLLQMLSLVSVKIVPLQDPCG
jgi:low temperature requirement protein LtrA